MAQELQIRILLNLLFRALMRLTPFGFVWRQLFVRCKLVKADLSGKTVVVIGANAGLGYEATKHFATMNPSRIIMVCRNLKKGGDALKSMKHENETIRESENG